MNSKTTWIWALVAGGLFAFIFLFEPHFRKPAAGPIQILPGFNASAVTSVLVRPVGQLEIRVERTNTVWLMTKPVVYPAQATRIESLLSALEHLTPAAYITAHELRLRPKSEEEYGFETPRVSLLIQEAENRRQILIGNMTAPGDQFFLQVVGLEGVYVVDAGILKLIPRVANDWRKTSLVGLSKVVFNRIVCTNAGKVIEFQLDPTNHLWRMIRPLLARADNDRIFEVLAKLQALRVIQFVSDDSKADLESFGLQPADLEITLARGTNIVVSLQFGKNPTNDAGQVYARQRGINSVVTVASELVAPWRAGVQDFRDPHLLDSGTRPDQIEIHGEDDFVLERRGSNDWGIASQNIPVDAAVVNDFINGLTGMQIVQFVKDVVTAPDLPGYGLAVNSPKRQVILKSAVTNATGLTNIVLAELSFGATQEDKVFARRSDEDFVYAVKLADLEQLPWASWQFRERRIWNFTENDVAGLAIHQGGMTQQLLHNGTNVWSLASGSQGIINEFAIEETVHRFGELTASAWVSCGDTNLDRYGFSTNSLSLVFDLKNRDTRAIKFGGMSPSGYPYAAATLEGKTWVFEFPLVLHQLVLSYLTIPGNGP